MVRTFTFINVSFCKTVKQRMREEERNMKTKRVIAAESEREK